MKFPELRDKYPQAVVDDADLFEKYDECCPDALEEEIKQRIQQRADGVIPAGPFVGDD